MFSEQFDCVRKIYIDTNNNNMPDNMQNFQLDF